MQNLESVQIAAYGVSPFDRLPSLRLLKNYTILQFEATTVESSLKSMDVKIQFFPFTFDEIGSYSTVKVIASEQFADWFCSKENHFTHFVFFEVTPQIQEIADKLGMKLIGPDSQIAQKLENKIQVRSILPKYLFAPFEICRDVTDIQKIVDSLGCNLVIQIPDSAGGRGTFFVRTLEELQKVVRAYPLPLLISRRKNGINASIQGVTLRNGMTFSTAPQLNYFGVSGLVCEAKESGQFCGGEWGNAITKDISGQAQDLIQIIGQKLINVGYFGIFGVDILVDQDKIWVIEINARQTGLTPIITYLCNQSQNTSLLDLAIQDSVTQNYHPANNVQLKSGLIQATNSKLTYIILYNTSKDKKILRYGIIPNFPDIQIVGLEKANKIIKPGGRLARLITSKQLVNTRSNTLTGKGIVVIDSILTCLLKNVITSE